MILLARSADERAGRSGELGGKSGRRDAQTRQFSAKSAVDYDYPISLLIDWANTSSR
jgi:hypothetical protein